MRVSSLLGVSLRGTAAWIDLDTHAMRGEATRIGGLELAALSGVVAALPTDDGGLLLLDSPAGSRLSRAVGARWVELAPSSLGGSSHVRRIVPLLGASADDKDHRTARDGPLASAVPPILIAASHAVRYGSLIYVLLCSASSGPALPGGQRTVGRAVAAERIGVYDAASLRLLRTLPLPDSEERVTSFGAPSNEGARAARLAWRAVGLAVSPAALFVLMESGGGGPCSARRADALGRCRDPWSTQRTASAGSPRQGGSPGEGGRPSEGLGGGLKEDQLGRAGKRCHVLVMERHARRSVRLVRGVASACGPVAACAGGLILLDAQAGRLVRLPVLEWASRAPAALGGMSPADNEAPDPVWRCRPPCVPASLSALAVDGDQAYIGHRACGANRTAHLIQVDLATGREVRWVSLAGVGRGLRLLQPPSTLSSQAYALIPLAQKQRAAELDASARRRWDASAPRPLDASTRRAWDAASARGGRGAAGRVRSLPGSPARRLQAASTPPAAAMQPFAMLGGVDIGPVRDALLREWAYLWGEGNHSSGGSVGCGRGPHSFDCLFPALAGAQATFPGLLNAKILFSGARVGVSLRAAAGGEGLLRRLPSRTSGSAASGSGSETCIVFPAWRRLSPTLLPLLDSLLGARLGYTNLSRHIWRVQLNRMPPGSHIKAHVDQGSYSTLAHRIHVPLLVPKCIRFENLPISAQGGRVASASGSAASVRPEWREVPMREGEAFEVNNKLRHRVLQSGPYERVSVVIDVAELPCARYIEVAPTCRGWHDPTCVSDFDVDEAEWRAVERL